jgi:hypothetical protein
MKSEGIPASNLVMNVYQDLINKKYDINLIDETNPEKFSDGLFLFHNPNVDHRVNPNDFINQGIIQVFKKKLIFSNNRKPLVCRINRSSIKPLALIQKLSLEELFSG